MIYIQQDLSLQMFGKLFRWKWKIWKASKFLKTKLEDENLTDVIVNFGKTYVKSRMRKFGLAVGYWFDCYDT